MPIASRHMQHVASSPVEKDGCYAGKTADG
jgi:hypothetical protein